MKKTTNKSEFISLSEKVMKNIYANGWVIASIPLIYLVFYFMFGFQSSGIFWIFSLIMFGTILWDYTFLKKKLGYNGKWMKVGLCMSILGIFGGASYWLFKREQNLQGNTIININQIPKKTVKKLGLKPEDKSVQNYKWDISKWFSLAYLFIFILFLLPNSLIPERIYKMLFYKEFRTEKEIAQIKSMDCDELFRKNLGKHRDFCGDFTGEFAHVAKQDLYNKRTIYCANSYKNSDDILCRIPIQQRELDYISYDTRLIWSFKATITDDCDYEYMGRTYKMYNYCLKDVEFIGSQGPAFR